MTGCNYKCINFHQDNKITTEKWKVSKQRYMECQNWANQKLKAKCLNQCFSFLQFNEFCFYELKFMLMQSFNKTNSKLILSICKLSDFKIGFECANYKLIRSFYLFIFYIPAQTMSCESSLSGIFYVLPFNMR